MGHSTRTGNTSVIPSSGLPPGDSTSPNDDSRDIRSSVFVERKTTCPALTRIRAKETFISRAEIIARPSSISTNEGDRRFGLTIKRRRSFGSSPTTKKK